MNDNLTTLSAGEIDDVIDIIRLTYGYDFRDYARPSFERRISRCMDNAGIQGGYDLRFNLTNDPQFFAWFLQSLTVNVTELFRDPAFYRALREKVLPTLASYPILKIWHAGCSTGEEVFSMAILLHEAGLLDRTRIYATDINPANLEKARAGALPLPVCRDYALPYKLAGGRGDLADYYTEQGDLALLDRALRRNIIFSQHNLVTDGVFNEFQLICCRNVLIYFNRALQDRAVQLFHDSLSPLGYLAIGLKESLLFTEARSAFEAVSPTAKIYRRHQ